MDHFAQPAPVPGAANAPVHRGALAGLSPAERAAAVEANIALYAREHPLPPLPSSLAAAAEEERPVFSYAEALAQGTKDELLQAAREMGLKGCSRMTKAQLAEALAARDMEERSEAWFDLTCLCPEAEYATLRRTLEAGGVIMVAQDEVDAHRDLAVFPPLTSAFLWEGTYTLCVAQELQAAFAAFDWGAVEARRARVASDVRCIAGLCMLCGIVRVDEALEACNAWSGSALDEDAFLRNVLMAEEVCLLDFSVTQIGDELYFEDLLLSEEAEKLESPEDEEAFEGFIQYLVDCHAATPRRPLPDELRTMEPLDWKFGQPAVTALMAFFDERVPEGDDDYAYAERMVEEFVVDALASSAVRDQLDFLVENGVSADVVADPALRALLTTFNDEMPRWDNNGWSNRELREQATGRKVFRNADGSEQKVGRNDPCPCGSGKKYKKCCGK